MLYIANAKQTLRCAMVMFVLASPLAAHAAGPASVNLGAAARFAILSKTGITDVPRSAVTGRVGTSPITGAADHLSCAEVTGWVFSVDAAGPAPCSQIKPGKLRLAVLSMGHAYTDAAGRAPNVTGLGAGNIGGLTISAGVYKWGTGVLIPSDVTLEGSATDTWIFQISQNLRIDAGKRVILKGGARARNIVWQVAGQTVIESTARFEGVILCKSLIAMKTGASIRGRLLAQTAVTLEKNTVSAPQS
jgi:Ice-binding-like